LMPFSPTRVFMPKESSSKSFFSKHTSTTLSNLALS
jgi:hypothetical protein